MAARARGRGSISCRALPSCSAHESITIFSKHRFGLRYAHPSLNIIVVEDHDALRDITVEALRSQGHQVVGVESAEALNRVDADSAADLMVIDLNLPGEDGISLSRRLRAARPDMGIVMVTARTLSSDRARGYDSGRSLPHQARIDRRAGRRRECTRSPAATVREPSTTSERGARARSRGTRPAGRRLKRSSSALRKPPCSSP